MSKLQTELGESKKQSDNTQRQFNQQQLYTQLDKALNKFQIGEMKFNDFPQESQEAIKKLIITDAAYGKGTLENVTEKTQNIVKGLFNVAQKIQIDGAKKTEEKTKVDSTGGGSGDVSTETKPQTGFRKNPFDGAKKELQELMSKVESTG